MAVPKSHSPQLGYNHNIPHRGRLYHVQTEDSGRDKAHIFTHVFFDGTIVASNKVNYAQEVDATDLDPLVINLMQTSHKDIIRQLRGGSFDDKIVRLIGAHPVSDNSVTSEMPQVAPADERPERAPPPSPRDIVAKGPALVDGTASADPTIGHPVTAQADGKRSKIRRRAVGGIGGKGVEVGAPVPISQRRDIIVGKFASEHQAQLDEEILAFLREE